MAHIQHRIVGSAALIGIALIGVLLLVSAIFIGMYVAAIVVPVLGFGYALFKGRFAYEIWRRRGRFELPGNAVRIIGEGRARVLATIEALAGVGGFAFSLIAPALVFDGAVMLFPVVVVGLGLLIGTRIARRRVSAGAQAVDVLPPE